MGTMSFHTLTVTKRLTGPEFGYIKDRMYQICKKKNKRIYQLRTKDVNSIGFPLGEVIKIYTVVRSELYKNKGILIDFIEFSEGTITCQSPLFYGIRIRVNPARVFTENDFISLTKSKDVERFFNEINLLLKKIAFNFPDFEDFSLNRIDYSYNCNLGDQEKVSKYLSLISKGYVPKKYNVEKFNNANGFKIAHNTVAIAAYNKMAQIQDQEKYFNNYAIIEKANGILRFEIQVEYMKAYSIMKNNDFKNIKEFLNSTDEIATKLFSFYLPKIVFKGDYYSYNMAKQKVLECKAKKRIQQHMLEFLYLATKCKNLNSVKKKLQKDSGLSSCQIDYCIERFNDIGVNPVTIPRTYREQLIINPLKLITIGVSSNTKLKREESYTSKALEV